MTKIIIIPKSKPEITYVTTPTVTPTFTPTFKKPSQELCLLECCSLSLSVHLSASFAPPTGILCVQSINGKQKFCSLHAAFRPTPAYFSTHFF